MLEFLGQLFLMLGGALTTLSLIYILQTISDKWLFKQMLPTHLILLLSGVGSIIVGYAIT